MIIDQQHLHRRGQIGRRIDPALGEIAGDIGGPERDEQQRAGLDHQQRRQPQAAEHDGEGIQQIHRRIELAEDGERGDKPGRDRHQLDDEGVAQHRGQQPDREPGQPELGGDHQQIAAARPGRVIHHHAGDDHQQGEHRRRGAAHHDAGEVPERQRPVHRQRCHVDAVANPGFRGIGDAGRSQDQAELQVEPG
ncbi:hypothetical protein ACVWW7_003204 [Bradyrhizobium sp. LM6.9]